MQQNIPANSADSWAHILCAGDIEGSPSLGIPVFPGSHPDVRAQLVAIVASVDDAIIHYDCDGIIARWDTAAERILGYTVKEAVGQSAMLIVPLPAQTEEQNLQTRLQQCQCIDAYRALRRHKNGSLRSLLLRMAPLIDAEGRIIGATQTLRDVMERRGVKAHLAHLLRVHSHIALSRREVYGDRLTASILHARRTDADCSSFRAELDRFELVNEALGLSVDTALLRAIVTFPIRPQTDSSPPVDPALDAVTAAAASRPVPRESATAADRTEPFTASSSELLDREFSAWMILETEAPRDCGARTEAPLQVSQSVSKGIDAIGVCPQGNPSTRKSQTIPPALLQLAFQRGEFVLHYQPIVNLMTGAITRAEALIRWNCVERGLVCPTEFVGVLEKTGMILEVGRWVMMQAVTDQSRWVTLGLAAPRMSINVSPIQLRQRSFLDDIEAAVAIGGTTPPRFDLELTESVLISDAESYTANLCCVRERCIGVALDDFGAGYSSLKYLARLPANVLKIDQSFIAAMCHDPTTMTIVSAIIELAHAIKLSVIAEGVETHEQLCALRDLRCDEVQGWIFCEAVPFEDFTELLRAHRRLPIPHDGATLGRHQDRSGPSRANVENDFEPSRGAAL
ncbi:MAG: EAL domain-containing protein [Gammaproteobacteria bacterium]